MSVTRAGHGTKPRGFLDVPYRLLTVVRDDCGADLQSLVPAANVQARDPASNTSPSWPPDQQRLLRDPAGDGLLAMSGQ